MPISSLEFLFSLILAAAVFPCVTRVGVRQALLAACNIAYLSFWLPNPASWLLLLVFLGSGYLAGVTLRARPSRGGFMAYLGLLLAAFIVIKKYSFLGFVMPAWILTHPIHIVGLSYMLFRQIHFVVDVMQGQVERPSIWSYLNYQLNLFALLAGPIQRYQDFRKSWDELEPVYRDRHELLNAYCRILCGFIKVGGIAAFLISKYTLIHGQLLAMPGGTDFLPAMARFTAIFYLYPLYMYMNFSGYCDIVIGGAGLLGMRLPENFDRPYLSRNTLEFWTRWHRTLGFWIRDYLFMPLYKSIAERDPVRAPSLAFGCYFIAFVLAGVWHGSTSNFFVFGLLHGVGASAAKLWETFLVNKKGRPFLKRYLQSNFIGLLAITGTLHYMAFTMLFFPASLAECVAPIRVLVGTVWQH